MPQLKINVTGYLSGLVTLDLVLPGSIRPSNGVAASLYTVAAGGQRQRGCNV